MGKERAQHEKSQDFKLLQTFSRVYMSQFVWGPDKWCVHTCMHKLEDIPALGIRKFTTSILSK